MKHFLNGRASLKVWEPLQYSERNMNIGYVFREQRNYGVRTATKAGGKPNYKRTETKANSNIFSVHIHIQDTTII
jgi:hypothetical protein